MTAAMNAPDSRTAIDANLIVTKQFAEVFHAYLECSDEIQAAIRAMVQVMKAPDVTEDEYHGALLTIAEVLFPTKHNGSFGVDVDEYPDEDPEEASAALKQMAQEEAIFAERLAALLESKGITQAELAAQVGVGKPAISMMLARNCRPQKRTVLKLAEALGVRPEVLWPDIGGRSSVICKSSNNKLDQEESA